LSTPNATSGIGHVKTTYPERSFEVFNGKSLVDARRKMVAEEDGMKTHSKSYVTSGRMNANINPYSAFRLAATESVVIPTKTGLI
jgi:hypothetical protein